MTSPAARRTLRPPAGYRLAVADDEIDSRRFERAVGRAGQLLTAGEAERAAVVLADALTLWRGRPFDEVAALRALCGVHWERGGGSVTVRAGDDSAAAALRALDLGGR